MTIAKLKHYLLVGIWRQDEQQAKGLRAWLNEVVRTLYLTVRFFIERGHIDYATALSFSTMLAIVPVAAVMFAIARGFGLSIYIEQWFRSALSSQPQVAETIINFANSYLVHARSGVILGLGLVFMLYSVLSLISNIEHVFDSIWQVKAKRSPLRLITDYTSLLLLIPIIIIIISGLNIFAYGLTDRLQSFLLVGPLARFLLKLMPFVLLSCVFTGLYVFMPNTKVRLSKAIVPGTIAGVAMQLLQLFYVHAQSLLTSYNAIYGSFAALPLFMLWMQISWYICLFCAELSYMNQNTEYYAFLIHPTDISHDQRMEMSAALLAIIAQRFADGRRPLTALELKNRTHIPIRIATDLLERLCEVNLLISNHDSSDDSEPTFQPAQDLRNITVGRMVELLDSHPRRRNRYLSFHAKDVIGEEKLGMIEDRRNAYIEQMKQIPVTELAATGNK